MMETSKIYNEDGIGFYRIFSTHKIEKVNPVEYFQETELVKRALVIKDLLFQFSPILAVTLTPDFYLQEAKKLLHGFFEEYEQTEINPNLLKLLSTTRKKDQIRLLNGVSLTTAELMALIFKSYTDFGYLYSRYLFENLPNGLEGKKLPKWFGLNDDGVMEKIGDTDLTDGELKNIISHRKVIVSNFFEKDDIWHCFFITYASIGGLENWKEGQTHFHYISSSFEITKENFIKSMQSGKYLSTSVHIDLKDYGIQT